MGVKSSLQSCIAVALPLVGMHRKEATARATASDLMLATLLAYCRRAESRRWQMRHRTPAVAARRGRRSAAGGGERERARAWCVWGMGVNFYAQYL